MTMLRRPGSGRKRGGRDSQVLRPMMTVWPGRQRLEVRHVFRNVPDQLVVAADDAVFGDGGDDDDFGHDGLSGGRRWRRGRGWRSRWRHAPRKSRGACRSAGCAATAFGRASRHGASSASHSACGVASSMTKPLAVLSASVVSLTSITVSARPPVARTMGGVP
jgi:hypothetical protein